MCVRMRTAILAWRGAQTRAQRERTVGWTVSPEEANEMVLEVTCNGDVNLTTTRTRLSRWGDVKCVRWTDKNKYSQ